MGSQGYKLLKLTTLFEELASNTR